VAGRMASAAENDPWKSPLPTHAWDTYAIDLAGELDEDLLKRLGVHYTAVAVWNGKAERATRFDVTGLADDETAMRTLATDVGAAIKSPPRRSVRGALNIATSLMVPVLVIGLIVAGIALFEPRPYLTAETVTQSVQAEFPGKEVDCDPAHGDWHCEVVQFERRQGACPRVQSIAAARPAPEQRFASTTVKAAPRLCAVEDDYDVQDAGGKLDGRLEGSTERELAGLRSQFGAAEKQKSAWDRFVSLVTGER
jgi:hypothetical protein